MNEPLNIIVLTGVSGSGKDRMILEAMKENSFVVRRSFSDQLRNMSSSIFPWLPNNAEQDFKNAPFEHIDNDNNLPPREIWKRVAKTVRSIQDSIFAKKLGDQLIGDINFCLQNGLPERTVFFISDLRSVPEYETLRGIQECYPTVNMKFIRINDPLVSKEEAADIDKPTFDFEVDAQFVNHKTERCITGFLQLVEQLCTKD